MLSLLEFQRTQYQPSQSLAPGHFVSCQMMMMMMMMMKMMMNSESVQSEKEWISGHLAVIRRTVRTDRSSDVL